MQFSDSAVQLFHDISQFFFRVCCQKENTESHHLRPSLQMLPRAAFICFALELKKEFRGEFRIEIRKVENLVKRLSFGSLTYQAHLRHVRG